jgi:PIN domain nuclease of toxin-antitoxin system
LKSVAEKELINILAISITAIIEIAFMEMFDRDPFDRLFAATALIEGRKFVSIEQDFEEWAVSRVW